MTIEWAWYVPVDGDGNFIGTQQPERAPTVEYLSKTIQTAEECGFDMVLIPTQLYNRTFSTMAPYADTWSMACALAMVTNRIRLLVATTTGEIFPPRLAKMGATLDEITGGRFAFNIVTGSEKRTQYGEVLDHDTRYQRTKEVIQMLKALWTQNEANYTGEFYQLENAVSVPKPLQKPYPPIYFAGVSESAKEIAAQEVDVHLMQGETPDNISVHIRDITERAKRYGRSLRFGVRLQVIVRDTEKEAMDAAYQLLSHVDSGVLAHRSALYQNTESVQQSRLNVYGSADDIIAPNLWSGIRKVRAGAGNALVGTPEQVAQRLAEYFDVGITTFILSGYPLREEAKRIGRDVIPLASELISQRTIKLL